MPIHFSREAHLLAGVPIETFRSGAQMQKDADSRALLRQVTWEHLEDASARDPALRAAIGRIRAQGWSPAEAVKRLKGQIEAAIAAKEAFAARRAKALREGF